MTEYCVLKKVPCTECKGTGLFIYRGFSTGMGKVVSSEQDCKLCEGKGFFYEHIIITEELINEIRENFMRDHDA